MKCINSPTPALVSGLISYLSAIGLLFVNVQWAVIPLFCFVLICLVAPFFPAFGFFLPVISRGRSGQNAVALTFDDGPDPRSTPHLLRILARHNVPATFFVTGKKAEHHPELMQKIISSGHLLGNHTYHHDNFIMLKSQRQLERDIDRARKVLMQLGIDSRALRPPVGITNPKLHPILKTAGMICVNFNRRAFDAGNRRIFKLSQRILKKNRADDIMMLHDVPPKNKKLTLYWLNEIELIIAGLNEKGLKIIPLDEIIGETVMTQFPPIQKKT